MNLARKKGKTKMPSNTQAEDLSREHEDADLLYQWYRFASHQPGFIGTVLREQRAKRFQTEAQQRLQLGIPSDTCEPAWTHLQGMPLPRSGVDFENDVIRIARHIEQQALKRHHITIAIDPIALGRLLTRGEMPA